MKNIDTSPYIKSPFTLITYGLFLSSTAIFFGYTVGLFNNFFSPFIEQVYLITSKKEKDSIQANINFLAILGGTLACILSGKAIEVLGRYKFLVVLSFFQVLTGVFLCIKNLKVLYFCRFLSGFLMCASTFICPLMIKEIIPQKYSLSLSASFYLFLTGGILIASLIGGQLWLVPYWPIVLSLPSILEAPKFLSYLFFFRYESPKTIMTLSNSDSLLEEHLSNFYSEQGVLVEKKKLLDESIQTSDSPKVNFAALFSKKYRLAFGLGMLLNFMNQATGINFLVMYSKDIYIQLGISSETATLFTTILGLLNFLGAIYITAFSSLHGKKSLLLIGIVLQGSAYYIFLIGYTLSITQLVVAGTFIYIFAFSISLGGSLYSYLADIVPVVGLGIAAIAQWLIGCFVGLYAKTIVDVFKPFKVFFSFMLIAFIGAIIFAGYGIDTEGKSDTQIQKEFEEKEFLQ